MATNICGPIELLKKTDEVSSCEESFSICLPFGAHLDRDGDCLSFTPADTPPEDGEYSGIIIKNGCIQGVRRPEDPLYTSAPCAPIPQPCDCEGGGATITPSSLPGNLFSLDAAGRGLAQLNTKAGDGILISGTGTETDPLTITAKKEATMKLVSGTPSIITIDPISGGYSISHTETKSEVRTINGMTFDSFGHLASYTEPSVSSGYLTAYQVLPGESIMTTVDNTGPTVTIDLKDTTVKAGDYLLGGNRVVVSSKGVISSVSQDINIPAGDYAFGNYLVTVNELGSITDIAVIADAGDVTHSLTKKITAGTSTVTINFTLAAPSGLRVSIKCATVPNCDVSIDDNNYSGDKIGANLYEVVTNATFAQGPHTVVIKPSGSFPSIAIVDVVLNTVV